MLRVWPSRKTEPKKQDAYWQRILEDFAECGPYGGKAFAQHMACCQIFQDVSVHHFIFIQFTRWCLVYASVNGATSSHAPKVSRCISVIYVTDVVRWSLGHGEHPQ